MEHIKIFPQTKIRNTKFFHIVMIPFMLIKNRWIFGDIGAKHQQKNRVPCEEKRLSQSKGGGGIPTRGYPLSHKNPGDSPPPAPPSTFDTFPHKPSWERAVLHNDTCPSIWGVHRTHFLLERKCIGRQIRPVHGHALGGCRGPKTAERREGRRQGRVGERSGGQERWGHVLWGVFIACPS